MREDIARWTCDYCQAKEETPRFDSPDRWQWEYIVAQGIVKHRCHKCAKPHGVPLGRARS